MRFGWIKDQDNISYVDVDKFADYFGQEIGVDNFREELENFKANPVKEGVLLKGKKRTTLKMFIPDLYFEDKKEKLLLGESVWIFLGEHYPCYCIYWPDDEK